MKGGRVWTANLRGTQDDNLGQREEINVIAPDAARALAKVEARRRRLRSLDGMEVYRLALTLEIHA